MASLFREGRGFALQFRDASRKRWTIRLGDLAKHKAEAVKRHVERILATQKTGAPLEAATVLWLEEIGDTLRGQLVHAGLCQQRAATALGPFLDSYVASRTDLSDKGRHALRYAKERLVGHFGAERDMRGVRPKDAAAWLVAAKSKWSAATVGRDVGFARQFWRVAAEQGVTTGANPFGRLRAPSQANPKRYHYVSHADALKVLDACPDWKWRLVFSLARWGGLRCPSELRRLTWADVMFDVMRLRVHGKTGVRVLPMFPELAGPLNEAWDHAEEGVARVLPWLSGASANQYKKLRVIVARAGLKMWPRCWHNLRSTRQTELEDQLFRPHVVASWLGNSPQTARKHYLQLRDEDFERAVAGAKSAARGTNSDQSGPIGPNAPSNPGVISSDPAAPGAAHSETNP